MNVLLTGGAGFIGSHVAQLLVESGRRVACVDNFDPFYPPEIKRRGIAGLLGAARFHLIERDVCDLAGVEEALRAAGWSRVDVVIHLAARAGVRPSIADPVLYSRINVEGTAAALELARRLGARRFIFGSSSSVYGNNAKVPFSETDPVEWPISPYAASKRAGELLCHSYHHLYGLSVICLRFFTVYGPRQRPDLAIHKFARLLAAGRPVPMYGDGSTERDYTYIDDILRGIEAALTYEADKSSLFEIINLGESRTTSLRRLIELLADALGVTPVIEPLPPQPGDVQRTFADVSKAGALLGYRPGISIEEGVVRFVDWFRAEAASAVGRAASPHPAAHHARML